MTVRPQQPDVQELADILRTYNDVTERLQRSHDRLQAEVARLSSELETTNRELRRKETLATLGRMAAGVAHEVGNPLCAIKLNATDLRRRLQNSPHAVPIVDKIIEGVEMLDRIVEGFLALSSDRPLALAPVDVGSLIAAALEYARPQIAEKSIEVHSPETAASVLADAEKLQRAFLNIILNGVAMMPPGGRLSICVDEGPDGVAVSFSDTGPGIDETARDKLFNPFFTSRPDGTGLGLAITQRIVEQHNGSIEARNAPEGGARFVIRIGKAPAQDGDGRPTARS